MLHTVSCRPFSANTLFSNIKPHSVIPSSVAELWEIFCIKIFTSSSSSGVKVLSKHFFCEIRGISIGLGLYGCYVPPGTPEFQSHSRNHLDLYRIKLQNKFSIGSKRSKRLMLLTENTLQSRHSSWFKVLSPES